MRRPEWKALCWPLLRATPKERTAWFAKVLVGALIVILGAAYVADNWRLLWDRQVRKCMDVNVLLFHTKPQDSYRRGDILVFESRNAEPVFPNGMRLAKVAAGVPGDVVEITSNERILVNGVEVARGLPYLDKIEPQKRSKFYGRRTLGEDEYWMMGTTERSFDSRYWGSIHAGQILGKAWVLF